MWRKELLVVARTCIAFEHFYFLLSYESQDVEYDISVGPGDVNGNDIDPIK
jgi:hypothetical protein